MYFHCSPKQASKREVEINTKSSGKLLYKEKWMCRILKELMGDRKANNGMPVNVFYIVKVFLIHLKWASFDHLCTL